MHTFPPTQPTLENDRLLLRPLSTEDAPALSAIGNDEEVAKKLSSMPYLYTLQKASAFIAQTKNDYKEGEEAHFAIVKKADVQLTGVISIDLSWEHNHGTIDYWLGKEYWGKGYATEAAATILRFAFEELKLYRVTSHHFHTNMASGKVMQKIGMQREGRRRGHFKKDGNYLDILDYGILCDEYRG